MRRESLAAVTSSGPRPSGRRPAGEPLVARRDPVGSTRVIVLPRSRFREFVRRYGWRAYAVPLLALATLVALLDVVRPGAGGDPTPTASADAVVETTAPATPTAPPVTEAEGEGMPTAVASTPTEAPAETVPAAPAYVEQGAGSVSVVDGTSGVYGTGPLERFVVEVEDGIDVDGAAFASAVEGSLGDPRSWGGGGRLSFQRVGAAEAAAGAYDFRVSLISPGSMEIYCPGVGTGGYTSCRYGERAVINLARWETAVPHYGGDVPTYRQYVINHEVGHALGHGHQPCPAPGQLARVMQQQTFGLQGCVKNAWPFPS